VARFSCPSFRNPNPIERAFNRVFGFLVGLGLGLSHNYLLQVRGRNTGRIYSTPIDLLEFGGKRYLVAPCGWTQWVRNAEVAGEVMLKKGRTRQRFRLRSIPDAEKPELLKAQEHASGRQVICSGWLDSALRSPFPLYSNRRASMGSSCAAFRAG